MGRRLALLGVDRWDERAIDTGGAPWSTRIVGQHASTSLAAPPSGHLPHRVRLTLIAALVAVATAIPVASTAAAGTHYYVDGKRGNDGNAGTSLGAALKTVERALALGRNAGTTISIVGYSDYTYFESIETPYTFLGTSSAPIVIEGYRPPNGSWVRPTISGALIVNKPGSTRWSRPNSTTYPNVWRTPWSTPVAGYDAAHNSSRMDVVFMDGTNQLRRPATTPTLAQLNAQPGSEYWDGTYLYVHLGTWEGTAIDKNPNNHLISIPHYRGIIVNNDSGYVTIRDLRVVHAVQGIAFYTRTHHSAVTDVELSYNYVLGLYSQGFYNTFTRVTGRRNSLQLIKLESGAHHNILTSIDARQHPGMGVKITGATTAYNEVKYSTFAEGEKVPAWVASYSGEAQGIDIEQGSHHNLILGNTIRDMGRGLMLYQYDSSGGPLTGNRIERNFFDSNFRAVYLADSRSGGNGSGAVTFYRNTYSGNGNAIYAASKTTNKTFKNETIYNTVGGPGTGYNSAIFVQYSGTRISLSNVIISKSKGYAIYAAAGAAATTSYTDVYAAALGRSKGSVTWGSGSRTIDPRFLSTSMSSTSFLYIDSTSPLHGVGSGGLSLGSRWK